MFLPISKKEIEERGWECPDFVLITGDAYVDHPSFGTAIIGRVLERHGYKVAVLPQPDWKDPKAFQALGRPRLGFLINSGNVDSMVNHYSVWKHRRKRDDYSPGGISGRRPDRAVIVYSQKAREAYHDVPIIIGGLEASLRRLGHYDYWEDKVRRSILLDAKADLLIYGMGERAVVEIAEALDSGLPVREITWIPGTCVRMKAELLHDDTVRLPDYAAIRSDRDAYGKSFAMQYRNNDFISGKQLAEHYGEDLYVVQNPPQEPLSREELDYLYALPFEREYHPSYEAQGGVPALREVKFSLTSSRGCFGGCSFCALTFHQGRELRSRSRESLVEEAKRFIEKEDFKGYIHDVGGPTANFRKAACKKQGEHGVCRNKDCLYPEPCSRMEVDHKEYLEVLRSIRELEGVKKVFIRSGIRYDYVMADPDDTFLWELCKHHVSGTLKVAPEHISEPVLKQMRKPAKEVFLAFSRKYSAINEKLGKKQYLIPYLISSHPGSTLENAIELAVFLKEYGFVPDQVQDFYPTPGTLSTCIYYTEKDPFTGEAVFVPKTPEEKKMQRALLHFHKPENRKRVREALTLAQRQDLIPVLLPEEHRGGDRKAMTGRKQPGTGKKRNKGKK